MQFYIQSATGRQRQVEWVDAGAVFVHELIRFDRAVLVELNRNAILAVQLAIRQIWICLDTSLGTGEIFVEKVHPVDVRWSLLSPVELDVALQTASVPDSSDKRAANKRLAVVVLPCVLFRPRHDVLDLIALLCSHRSNLRNGQILSAHAHIQAR